MNKNALLVLLIFCTAPSALVSQTVFPCSTIIEDDYGVCTHITRKWMDFDIRDRELALTHQTGISWVRSDLDFGTYLSSRGEEDPSTFDAVLNSCDAYSTHLLGILTGLGKRPWHDPNYAELVHKLAQRYDGRISHWEVLNEVNLIPEEGPLDSLYVSTLRSTYETLKRVNGNNQVLLSGLAEVTSDFLSDISQKGAYRYFDIMNFHSYLPPESLIPSFERIDSVMRRDGWKKPVWFTECGMHTAESGRSSEGFFTDMLPCALRRIGIDEQKTCIGVLRDAGTGYNVLSDEETDVLLRPYCRQVRSLSFDELAGISIRKMPVLIATRGELFPAETFPTLVDYVRRGGTIVLCGGMPFYYDAACDADIYYQRKEMGTSLYAQLHMSPQNAWNVGPTDEKLTEMPSVVLLADDADYTYQWTFDKESPARYLSADNLQQGDTLISLIRAGTPHIQGSVAGIYKLDSDLHGNIIFQTRMYASLLADREQEQARRLPRIYLLSYAYGISKVFWYNLRSRENDLSYSEDCFGLIHADFSEKPSMQAYRTLVKVCPKGSTRPQLTIERQDGSTTHDPIYRCCWQMPDGTPVTALWTAHAAVPYKIKSFRGKITDHLGRPLKAKHHSIKVSPCVTYLIGE